MRDHQEEIPSDQHELIREMEITKLSSLGFRVFPRQKAVIHPLPKNDKNREKNKRAKISRKKNR